jgi:hypothetical protein
MYVHTSFCLKICDRFQLEAYQFRLTTLLNESKDALCFKHDSWNKSNSNRVRDILSETNKLAEKLSTSKLKESSGSSNTGGGGGGGGGNFLSFDIVKGDNSSSGGTNKTAASKKQSNGKKKGNNETSNSSNNATKGKGGQRKKGQSADAASSSSSNNSEQLSPAALLKARRNKAVTRVETYLEKLRNKMGLGPLGTSSGKKSKTRTPK